MHSLLPHCDMRSKNKFTISILFVSLVFIIILYHRYTLLVQHCRINNDIDSAESAISEYVKEVYTELIWRKRGLDEDCFHYHIYDNRTFLPNILEHNKQPNKYNKNIFIHETSCTSDGIIKIKPRQACAIESAAKMNPDWDIFVLFTARVGFNNKTRLPLFDQLSSYPNIHLRHVNINSYTKDTPMGDWMAGGVLYTSPFFNVQIANALRLISLWKYGGTYLDMDVIVTKSLNPLETNYAGEQSENYINSAVLNFDNFNGHKIVDECVKDFMANFKGSVWGHNGPELITRVLKRVCHTNTTSEMISENCNGFKILPQQVFYPIPYQQFRRIFKADNLKEVMTRLENSTIVHFWNKLTFNSTVRVNESTTAYGVLANNYCQKVYFNCGEYF